MSFPNAAMLGFVTLCPPGVVAAAAWGRVSRSSCLRSLLSFCEPSCVSRTRCLLFSRLFLVFVLRWHKLFSSLSAAQLLKLLLAALNLVSSLFQPSMQLYFCSPFQVLLCSLLLLRLCSPLLLHFSFARFLLLQ